MGQGNSKPQQRELDRSGRGAVDPDQAKAKNEVWGGGQERGGGPIPEDNRPGHHPEKEQDKPGG